MDVVVVQARDDRSARGVEHLLARAAAPASPTLDDPLVDADVGGGAVKQDCPLNQHEARPSFGDQPFDDMRCRHRAPTPGGDGGGRCGAARFAGVRQSRRRLRRRRPSTTRSVRRRRGAATPRRASAACRPVSGSAMASPQNTGPSSPPPTKPPETAASSPNATQLARSPSVPWPVIRSQTRPSRGVDVRRAETAACQRRGRARTRSRRRRRRAACAGRPARRNRLRTRAFRRSSSRRRPAGPRGCRRAAPRFRP